MADAIIAHMGPIFQERIKRVFNQSGPPEAYLS